MNKVNFKKVVFGVSLGTVMVLGSISSAFAADINHPTAQAKTVELHQQKSNPQPDPKPNPNHPNHPTPTPTPSPSPNHPNPKHQPRQQVTLLTQDQAKAIALTQYKGAVKDIQLTKENGKDVYNIVIHEPDGKDRTVKMDAVTGVIMNTHKIK